MQASTETLPVKTWVTYCGWKPIVSLSAYQPLVFMLSTSQPFQAKAYTIENKRLIPSGFRKHKVNRVNNIRILCR
jgi:hypothetical protein